jgi:polyhydroxyalkanoate synthesis regulator phasin
MSDGRTGGVGEGIRSGVGILAAFKDAIEQTLAEAIERGDLSPERAKAAMLDAADRAQQVISEARERLDVVPRKEFDALAAEVVALRERLERVEGVRGGGGDVIGGPPPLPSGSIPVD